ncbi:MAG: ABC transporter ATP-binding protein [Candidatus Moraniibacteriota bacterium]
MEILASLKDVHKEYRMSKVLTIPALNGVTLDIFKGEFLAITGHSGSGKSTMLNILGLLDEPTRGEMYFAGHEVHNFTEKQRVDLRLNTMSFVFQFFNLIDNYTALENIKFQLFLQGCGGREANRRSQEIIDFLGLKERASFFPHELSGGEQQRVAIGRALAKDSLIIMADEPTAHLDSANGQATIQLLHDINKKFNRTVVLVTHEEEEARHADRNVMMSDGKILEIKIHQKIEIKPE